MTNRTAATCPTDPWASEVQPLIADLRRQVAWKELQHREALEALETACDQRDEARRQSSQWRKLARVEAERADNAQPLTRAESRGWTLFGMLCLIGSGVYLGMQARGWW